MLIDFYNSCIVGKRTKFSTKPMQYFQPRRNIIPAMLEKIQNEFITKTRACIHCNPPKRLCILRKL